jgi:hypothetical protein
MFVHATAKHRGVSTEAVLENMADGRIFIGQQAIDAGLADGFSSLEQLIEQLNVDHSGSASHRADAAHQPLTLSAKATETKAKATTEGESMDITKEMIASDHPEIAAAFRAEGATEGASAERQRIQDVESQHMAGHDDLIRQLKFDGTTTGPEAAVQVLNAEKGKRARMASDLQADSPDALPAAPHAGADDLGEQAAEQLSPRQVADAARALVVEAEQKGLKLSVAHAVKQVTAAQAGSTTGGAS